MIVGEEENADPPATATTLNIEELFREGIEKEARLASEDFWDRFERPTEEELELEKEQQDRANEEGSSEDDEEAEEVHYLNCLADDKATIIEEEKDKMSDDEEVFFESIQSLFPFEVGSWQSLACFMGSSVSADVLGSSEYSARTAHSLFRTLLAKSTIDPYHVY